MSQTLSTTIKIILFFASIAVLLFVSSIGSATIGVSGFGFSGQTAIDPAWPIGGLTILGVVASIVVSALRKQRQNDPLDFRAFLRSLLVPQTFIAFCISPVVFFGALLALSGKDLGPSMYLAAFQNGFFWQRVLDAKSE